MTKNSNIQMSGDVFLTDGIINAYSKNATYDIKNGKIVLTDGAKAKRDENEVYGDKITVLLGQNKIVIEGRTKARIKEKEIQ